MRRLLTKLLVFVAFRCRVYVTWSKLYRWLYERHDRNSVPEYDSLDLLNALMSGVASRYRPDGPLELFDAISDPEAVRNRILIEGPIGDCEDFAVYQVAVVNRSFRHLRAQLMFVMWPGGGHAVCLVRDTFAEGYTAMDYGTAREWRDTASWCAYDIAEEYAPGVPPVAYAVLSEDLELQELVWM